jgi:hypothetical protein
LTLIYVSSMRQLTHTGRLRRCKASSNHGLYGMTQRLIVA